MLRNPQLVYDKAEETAERWREKMEAYREEQRRVRRELDQKAKAHVRERQAPAKVGGVACCAMLLQLTPHALRGMLRRTCSAP